MVMDQAMLTEIKKAAAVLKQGGIILYPTDTVWGIGCDATNAQAIDKIYKLKKRNENKSMIVLLDSESRLPTYVQEIPEQAWTLIEFAEQPLTIIFDKAKNLADNVIAADGSIAIRITKDDFCKNLIGNIRKPLVSTSANMSGFKTPEFFADVADEIINGVDHVVNWRQNDTQKRNPSVIMRLSQGGKIEFIRS
jgi:L-threonylcarbamoyladenylate synthase